MKLKSILSFIIIMFCAVAVKAQAATVSGLLIDKKDNSTLPFTTVLLTSTTDSTQKNVIVTDGDGRFVFNNIPAGNYLLAVTFIGYDKYSKPLTVATTDIDLGTIALSSKLKLLKEVKIEGTAERVKQIGDTTQYNADAFKVHKDAVVEDLVAKMPGITVDNTGAVKAHGEDVKKVLIDGKEFFGDDATLALRNLPAEIVDKVQVFDRQSDQSAFSGFDDGNTVKALNITTRGGVRNAQFGKVFAGYGDDGRYNAGLSLNAFKGSRRITILGLLNDINQQNFSAQDLFSGFGGGGGNRGGGGGGRGGTGGGSNNPLNNFLVGPQQGITTTRSLGVNYADTWGKKVNVTGSYFFNSTNNASSTITDRTYYSNPVTSRLHQESLGNTSNTNQRVNARLEYNIDSANAIIVTPKISFQNTNTSNLSNSFGSNQAGMRSTSSNTNSNTDNMGYSLSNTILARHKFKKAGRTISLSIGTDASHKKGNSSLVSGTHAYNYTNDTLTSDVITNTDQRTTLLTDGYTLSTNLAYTEPVGKNAQVQVNYNPSVNKNNSDKENFLLNTATNDYTIKDNTLSNVFKNTINTQAAGLNYRWHNTNTNLTVGANYQYNQLVGNEQFPVVQKVNNEFQAVLPTLMYNYKFSNSKRLRVFYRTSSNSPSISQLQNVVDNSNPLLLTTGNPNLNQDYTHNLSVRYNSTNTEKAKNFFLFLNVSYVDNYIGNSTVTANADSTVGNGVKMQKGAQLSKPVNLDGYINARSFITYGLPVNWFKSNLNLTSALTYSRLPSMVNNRPNTVNTYTTSEGFVLGSNISDKIDFNLSYTGNYSIANNTLQPSLNTKYFYQTTSAKVNLSFLKGFVFTSDVTHTLYTGLSDSYNQNYFLWNAAFGHKFYKDAIDVRVSAYDILSQNKSLSRNVTDLYVEDTNTKVLQRYFMLTLTYTVRNFKKAS